jgi:glutamate dehydrogenase (NAD(P)+)
VTRTTRVGKCRLPPRISCASDKKQTIMDQDIPVLHEIRNPELGLEGYLAVHSVVGGLAFGGMRIDPNVTGAMVEGLASRMTMKLSGHGSPVGGAKAGLRVDPNDPRLPELLQAFAVQCRDELTGRTILGKDMGAKDWMIEMLYDALGMSQLDIVRRRDGGDTCPETIGELSGYIDRMTGQGVLWAVREALDQKLDGKRILIQGAGIVGVGVATRLVEAGAVVVGISDRFNALLDPAGIPLSFFERVMNNNGLLPTAYRSGTAQVVERDALLSQQADALILAAGSLLIDAGTASRIRCPVVVEGANFPLRPDSRQFLHSQGVWVVPDVIASSSSAAMVTHQIASANTLPVDEMWNSIQTSIETNVRKSKEISDRHDIDTVAAFEMMMSESLSATQ